MGYIGFRGLGFRGKGVGSRVEMQNFKLSER